MIKIGPLACLLTSLIAFPAHAALTDAENASMHHFRKGWNLVGKAMVALSNSVGNGENLNEAGEVARALARTHRFASQVWGNVFIGIIASNNKKEIAARKTWTRSQNVELSWEIFDRALGFLSAAKREVAALGLDGVVTQLDRAKAKFDLVDLTLEYADPLPPDHPQIIGPHGDYDAALKGMWLSVWYATGVQVAVAEIYASQPVTGESINTLRTFLTRGRDLTGAIILSTCNLVNCFQNDLKTQFFVVVGALKPLTVKAPSKFTAMMFSLLRWNPDDPKFFGASRKLVDAWRTLDARAVWNIMKFGDCEKTSEPALCAGFGG